MIYIGDGLCLTYASTFLSPGHKARIRLTIYHCLFRIGKKSVVWETKKKHAAKTYRARLMWLVMGAWHYLSVVIAILKCDVRTIDVNTLTVCSCCLRLWSELSLVKVLLSFIGRSGSNHSAFYLYKATSAGISSTLYYVYVQASKGCDLCTVKSISCTNFITMILLLISASKYRQWNG